MEYTYAVDNAPDKPGFKDRLTELEAEQKAREESLSTVIYRHEGDLGTIFRTIFTRSDPRWYKRGWFNAVLFVVAFTFSMWFIGFCGIGWWHGPLWLRVVILSAMIVSSVWVYLDAEANDRAGPFWAIVNLGAWAFGFGPLGLIIYIIFRL